MELLSLSPSYLRSCGSSVKVPTDWTRRNVTPIFKKGEEEDLWNYRPVTLTPVVLKVLEQILLECILRQMENKEVIGDNRHVYTKGRLCLIYLVAFHFGVTPLVDRRRVTEE